MYANYCILYEAKKHWMVHLFQLTHKVFCAVHIKSNPPNSAFTLSLNYIQIKGLIIFSVPGCYGLDVILLH